MSWHAIKINVLGPSKEKWEIEYSMYLRDISIWNQSSVFLFIVTVSLTTINLVGCWLAQKMKMFYLILFLIKIFV